MIVYNVQRRWFDMKADAERYRVSRGLPPKATIKVEIVDRGQLSGFLDALCALGTVAVRSADGELASVHAPVDPSADIPKFLVESWSRLFGGAS